MESYRFYLNKFLLVRSVVGLCFDNTSSQVKLETGRFNVSLFLALHSYLPLSFHTADLIMRSDLRLEKPSTFLCAQIRFWWIDTFFASIFSESLMTKLTANGQKYILFYSYLSIGHLWTTSPWVPVHHPLYTQSSHACLP